MNTRTTVAAVSVVLGLLLSGPPALRSQTETPYAGLERREIKALSPETIDSYHSGSGMGLALAAELNGFPGPKHVLELTEQLDLTQEQSERAQEVFAVMKSAAIDLGQRIVDMEAELDAQFAAATLTEEELETLVLAIGQLQGQLRFAHLRAHLLMVDILTPHQARMYGMLRGYEGSGHGGSHTGHEAKH